MNKTPAMLLTSLFWFSTVLYAQDEPRIGMEKVEIKRLFSQHIEGDETLTGGLALRMPFWGCDAELYLGFSRDSGDKVRSISVTFLTDNIERSKRLLIFKQMRKRLENMAGQEYVYVRIDGIDLLGESAGGFSEKNRCAIGFRTIHNGLYYHLQLFGETTDKMLEEGELELNIDHEEAFGIPTNGIPERGHASSIGKIRR